jgi:nitrogen fixation NifU-like protein
MPDINELYQQTIIEHHKKPRNFGKLEHYTHHAEGYNPLCGDHLHVYLRVGADQIIQDVSFEGDGCAISRSSASLMTESLKGKPLNTAKELFNEFHDMLLKKLDPAKDPHHLGKLSIFAGIWQYPSRVKCASLSWHTMTGALEQKESVSTE